MQSFSIASGKGGVGKTSFVINLALGLSQLKQKVLIFDADLGLANVDIMLGISPKFDIRFVLNGSLSLKDIIYETEYGFSVIPAGSGVLELTQLNSNQKLLLRAQMEEAFSPFDYLFFDISAGISDNVLFFSQLAEERIVILTPEPTSMADAYAYLKVLYKKSKIKNYKLIVNMAKDNEEGKRVFHQLLYVIEKFLPEIKISLLGILPYDECVKRAIRSQTPYLIYCPEAKISFKIKEIAYKILNEKSRKKDKVLEEFLERFSAL
ncbi:flagellar synthesis regulator FleN [Caldimicrobium thiodismutans]|uniref:Flagellar synthesis regulator FleN n=1 Tax=Caldimicrobium thiodismutans TaxID=1653476 RepID=A0A0U5AFH6_9BACT|nr:MinD/ParA family protein [Caldimicrobium thiodismutans]BAU22755.1 flagellar synthesis regulator FleN [Caldimicrobium thiodismutans]